ncbi:MAG: hypothetical protein A3I02_04660 [Betaproteobacteria bacterium RIFCSPLOWO2_02_FULL_67_26]|nr:MAG: hypothetical protein A3I02_04660 [Betaproteobacteria bacterium RIFCSPLOWO2_02_FULL_67_26]
MFQKLPSLPALAAFEAVARHKSFAKAARELCVTQSAVSHRIRALEDQFGSRFFVRAKHTVELTSQGTFLLSAVIKALSTLSAACARLAATRRAVKLSVGPAFARNWLIQRLGGFYRLHDDIDLEVNAVKLRDAEKLGALKSGEADIAIRYGNAAAWTGYHAVELMKPEVFPVGSPGLAVAGGGAVGPDILGGRTLLRLPRQPWKPWLCAAGLVGNEPECGPLFSDASLMLDAAAQGQGVALARSVLVEHDLATGRLVRLSAVSIPSDNAYWVVCLPEAVRRREVSAFMEWLENGACQGK